MFLLLWWVCLTRFHRTLEFFFLSRNKVIIIVDWSTRNNQDISSTAIPISYRSYNIFATKEIGEATSGKTI